VCRLGPRADEDGRPMATETPGWLTGDPIAAAVGAEILADRFCARTYAEVLLTIATRSWVIGGSGDNHHWPLSVAIPSGPGRSSVEG
jgi:hypothetical protein